jgi:hypothetical protein
MRLITCAPLASKPLAWVQQSVDCRRREHLGGERAASYNDNLNVSHPARMCRRHSA